jgi:hypothetical protein
MSVSGVLDDEARHWVKGLERREIDRAGCCVPVARRAVARRIGVAPGTLENIGRRRCKGVRGWLVEVLRQAFANELQREIERLTHEREMVLRRGDDIGARQAREVQAHLDAARRVLARGAREGGGGA